MDHLLVELKKVVNSNAALIEPVISVALHNVLNTVHGAGWNRRYFLFLLQFNLLFETRVFFYNITIFIFNYLFD
jgi:hypothetical protein